jgi:outer membrane protein assembly factor BamD
LETAVKLYPEVDIVDEVLFYLGRSYLKLGERDAASRVFRELVQNHPDSKFSDKARKALSELPGEGSEAGEG